MRDGQSKTTIDHDDIKKWVEERGGHPAAVKATKSGGSAMIRIDFGESEETLEEISWDDFFRIFDENNLAFLCQETTKDGKQSRFFKFVDRDAQE